VGLVGLVGDAGRGPGPS